MVDVKKLDLLYFSNDKPVPYELSNGSNKGKIINIHPIKVVDWGIFEKCLDVLLQEKQDYDNEDIIMMSYLDFVLNILVPSSVEDDGESLYAEKLAKVLELSLKIENIKTGTYRNRTCLVFDDETVLTSKEFDDIKKIILFQNLEDYDDRYVSPDVKKLYYDYLATINTTSVNPSLERKKTFVIGKTGISMNEINKMSYRVFNQIYVSAVETDIYYANKIIQSSQKYEMKEEIIHPLFVAKKDKYADLFVDKSVVESKVGKANS